MKFEGIITPLITPFTEDGKVFEKGLKELISFQIEKNINGLFMCGTYGLGPAMTIEERKRVAEIAVDQAKGKMNVIINVGSSSMETTIELAKHAEDIGADAVASTPPFYYTYDDESILLFYKQLLKEVNIPVFAYNYPERVGYTINSELLNRLAKEGIAGIKDSSFNILKFYEDILAVEKREFIFLIGTEELMFPAMVVGAKGCVPGIANVYPEIMTEFYKLIKEEKFKEAAIKQIEVIKLIKTINPTMTRCYEILKLRGINVGQPKKLFKRLTEVEVDELRDKLIKLGLIK
jgi:N-acetylneuraminate lyase/4-hydroxy-tetrahydrodipicolinate synthase